MYKVRLNKASEKKKISLATLLTGLVTISVLLTLTILLLASYQSQKKSLIETTLTLNHSTAAKMSQTMDSLFISMRSSLKNAAAFYSMNDTQSTAESEKHLDLIRKSSNFFNSIIVVDEEGIIRVFSPPSLSATGERVKTKPPLEALALKKPYISKPYVSAVSNRLLVFISEPLFDRNGAYRGFIGGSIYLQEHNVLNMIYGKDSIDQNGSYFYVVGSDGHLLYDPDNSHNGQAINDGEIVQRLAQGKSGFEQTVDSNGLTLLAGYSYVPESKWGVIVISPACAVNAELKDYIKSILLYTLIPFILLLLVTIGFARRLAKPFVTLSNLVGKIGKEEVVLPPVRHHWNREADSLTKTVILAMSGIKAQTDLLTQAAMTDVLTGLSNRRTLEIIMKQWVEEKKPYSILVLDIDRFKSINDNYGHQEGDKVLQHLAEIVRQSVRAGAVCSRYGGEEFVVLLPFATAHEVYETAERIRITMEKCENHLKQAVTVSLGAAHFPSQASHADALFLLADQALYKAKNAGRNQTVIAG
ncbi:sensor domain-containing diguanylate cyclase [Bacillus sp. FJAT-26390]|uniref:sensor domain-containing diguanylate cyclase n=1 Tax=Bacillus sp. FJAT-26390 TaxID=1743142 RepID=UPI0008080E37|nr:sensor domain-containing diguanylate cyclase [Bacillus sp. FJAT-26390]OBZ13296.1 diguanylate cyclase [Bacillus sp. FJAT-26390]